MKIYRCGKWRRVKNIAHHLFCEEDLYGILGVDRSASARDIKQAYKQLAKEWHPDKNKSPDANEKFMKINEAYETLSDEDKREEYDKFGTTSSNAQERHHRNPFGGGGFEGFTFHFGQGGPFHFNFQDNGNSDLYSKYKINSWMYESVILPESTHKPFFIYAYTDFCFKCMEVAQVWQQFVLDLEKLGLGIGTMNANSNPSLSRQLMLRSVPSITVVINRKLIKFNKNFELTADSLTSFLLDQSDSKVKVVMLDNRKQMCLRFVVATFAYKEFISSAYLNIDNIPRDHAVQSFLRKHKIVRGQENMLIFKEGEELEPVNQFTMSEISHKMMKEMIESNKFPLVPRIKNKQTFDHVCPVTNLKKYCILLLLKDSSDYENFATSFQQYSIKNLQPKVASSSSSGVAINFGYLYADVQSQLVSIVSNGEGPEDNDRRKILAMHRRANKDTRYTILPAGWKRDVPVNNNNNNNNNGGSVEDDGGIEALDSFVERLLSPVASSSSLWKWTWKQQIDVADESSEGIIMRYVYMCIEFIQDGWDYITVHISQDEMMIVMFMMTAVFVISVILITKVMSTLGGSGRNNQRYKYRQDNTRKWDDVNKHNNKNNNDNYNFGSTNDRNNVSNNNNDGGRSSPGDDENSSSKNYMNNHQHGNKEAAIEELNGSSYERLLLSSGRGWRLVVVFVAEDVTTANQKRLLAKFKDVVAAYSSPHYRFKFSYLRLTRPHISWCMKIAGSDVIPENQILEFPHRTVELLLSGMVFVLNAWQKCYHVFWSAGRSFAATTNDDVGDVSAAGFLGFQNDGDSEDDADDDDGGDSLRKQLNGRLAKLEHFVNAGDDGRGDCLKYDFLHNFDIWLEKLCEGTCPKYRVSDWPERMT
ncbi:hypothetical protein HELRODRAFT_193633 [Helobdella robusta]|uniref:J domain-containing protein n=1 Tax=Helobdella robusta TaxID=6412 RepID=T1FV77_HELRO|nr:hypothetical protein HELRODRAFT_193633 [Helobdella robusta]ESN95091.1 hypothetical protein HELRODRAFT_193633 [Helobdella robusta]